MNDLQEPAPEESLFPSGPWRGFYSYRGESRRHRMDLRLRFARGRVEGTGDDDVGGFMILGHYNGSSAEVRWTKSYPGNHDVSYRGYRDGQGIWGTWDIGPLSTGGFRIWPGDAPAHSALTATEEGVTLRLDPAPGASPWRSLRSSPKRPESIRLANRSMPSAASSCASPRIEEIRIV